MPALCHDEKHDLCCNLGSSNCNSKLQNDDIRRRKRHMQQYNSGILHTINYYDQEEDGVNGKEEEALDLLRMEEPCLYKDGSVFSLWNGK